MSDRGTQPNANQPSSGDPSAIGIDEYKELLRRSDPKAIYAIVANDIMRDHFNNLFRSVLLWLGIPSLGALLIGAWYVLEIIPEQAQAKAFSLVEANIMKSIDHEKDAVEAKREELAVVAAQAKAQEDAFKETTGAIGKNIEGANKTAEELQAQVAKLEDARNDLQKQIVDINLHLGKVSENPAVRQVLDRLGSASASELNALSSGPPKGALLLTLGKCESPWIAADGDIGGALLVAARKAADVAKESDLRLEPKNLPLTNLVGLTTTSTTATISLSATPEQNARSSLPQQLLLHACERRGCGSTPSPVEAQFPALPVTGQLGSSKPPPLAKLYSVRVCKLASS